VSSKSLIRIVFSGFFTLALLIPTSELKAGEHSSTISSESSSLPDKDDIDIFNPDLKKTFPFGDFAQPDSGPNNDQVCNSCTEVESEEVAKEHNQMDSKN
jgi:hypothetical protein